MPQHLSMTLPKVCLTLKRSYMKEKVRYKFILVLFIIVNKKKKSKRSFFVSRASFSSLKRKSIRHIWISWPEVNKLSINLDILETFMKFEADLKKAPKVFSLPSFRTYKLRCIANAAIEKMAKISKVWIILWFGATQLSGLKRQKTVDSKVVNRISNFRKMSTFRVTMLSLRFRQTKWSEFK